MKRPTSVRQYTERKHTEEKGEESNRTQNKQTLFDSKMRLSFFCGEGLSFVFVFFCMFLSLFLGLCFFILTY